MGLLLSTLGAATTVPANLRHGGAGQLEGRISRVEHGEELARIELEAAFAPDRSEPLRVRALLHAAEPVELEAGQRIRVAAKLRPLEPPGTPGESSAFEPRRRRGLLWAGSFDPQRTVVLSAPSAAERWLSSRREALWQDTLRRAPSRDAAALLAALSAGLRAELDDDLEEAFAKSGLAHVLSVSGLHVAALALALLWALRRLLLRVLPRRWEARRVAAPAAVPLLWAYVVFTGSQAPAVRSAIMASALLVGLALWRRADPLNGLALAAMALLTYEPGSVADLSTQMSFAAVGALVVLAPALREAVLLATPSAAATGWRRRWERLREGAVQTFCVSLAATLATAPLVAAAFHRISFAGLVANVVAGPLCALVSLVAATGAAVHVLCPFLAAPLLWAGGWAAQTLVWAAQAFAQLPGASWPVPSFGVGALPYALGLLWFCLGRDRLRWVGAAVAAGLLAFVLSPLPGQRAGLSVTFVAVGQGDAVVLSSGGRHALIDGGGVPDGPDVGLRTVLPFLREQRVRALELAVLSHPHPDHALGLASVLGALPTGRLWLGAGTEDGELTQAVVEAAHGARVERVEVGHPPLRLGEAQIEVLGPPRDRILLEGVNDRSVVLSVRHGEVSFLLPGDVEEAGEEALAGGPYTVLKAPHHGSRTSSSATFVARTRPRFVVFCVGSRNRFGFPHPETVARYRGAGARCLRTDLDGAITFRSDGQTVTLERYRSRSVEDEPAEPRQVVEVAHEER